ncbi:MAG: histidinol-phosphate transaminase [Aquificota bacterium]|nr:histidinol-phosphate transaminase [Aquificota bacterium]
MIPERIRRLKPYKTETSRAKVRLSSNELPYPVPEHLRKRIAEEIARVPFERYPDPTASELKGVLGEFFGVREENIVLGNGSDELIYYLSAVVGDGGGIYTPVPTFPMYEISADVMGRKKVTVPLTADFDIDLESSLGLADMYSLAYFAFPNNPTGNLFSRDRIRKIRERGVFVVLDEAYYHYSGETFLEDALRREDTAVLRTLSKIGMAGLRVGVLIAKEEVAREINKVRLPFNITYPSQVIAKVMLTEGREFIEESVEKVVTERERVFRELTTIEGVEPFPSRANFILFRTPYPADAVHSRMLSYGVLVRDVSYMPRLERCLRVSVGRPEENDAFLEALYRSVRDLGQRFAG